MSIAIKETVWWKIYKEYIGIVLEVGGELEEDVFDSRSQDFCWAFPAFLCVMRHIDDPQYLKGGKKENKHERIKAKWPNVQFEALRTVPRREPEKHELLHAAASRTISLETNSL